ncbi:hypothetical protein BKI52_12640 [marine bacterium AO1-C]|nr:hypothetical protein BKI52_12640 [marine bacterium AO1-C]
MDFLLSPEVQQFIAKNLYESPAKLMLSSSSFSKEEMTLIVGQIQARRKAQSKLPEWLSYPQIILPAVLSLEQSSSEITAQYKANYIAQQAIKKASLVDLTGGFGVDSYYFSKEFATVSYVEQNEVLVNQVKHNFGQLEAKNVIIYNQAAEYFLQHQEQTWDVIYLDPARRDTQKNKVFRLEDCTPDVLTLLPTLWSKTKQVFLKLAPMLDIDLAIRQLGNVAEVLVVAVNNECKELLFLLDQTKTTSPIIKTVNLYQSKPIQEFDFSREEEAQAKVRFSEPLNYLYEPNVAVLKAGVFKTIAQRFEVAKLHQHSHLYTSDALQDHFPGRIFKIKAICKYAKKDIRKVMSEPKANITTRNFPDSVATIRKKLGIKEGGDQYLFFTQTLAHKTLAIVTEKV